ncbi:hypothetical protein GQ42DRAFT_154695 [Ramicandelaber brevisporus]|nr:hypothetical protein GQ42DRAFT_154695 [Ramicandelaber brevisporus]
MSAQSLPALPEWVHIREAVPEDAAAAAQLHIWSIGNTFAGLFSEEYGAQLPSTFAEDTARQLTLITDINKEARPGTYPRTGLYLVAAGNPPVETGVPLGSSSTSDWVHAGPNKERIVGMAHYYLVNEHSSRLGYHEEEVKAGKGRIVELFAFHFVEEAQGNGIAINVFKRGVELVLNDLQASKMRLWTQEPNAKARAFYTKKTGGREIGMHLFPLGDRDVMRVCVEWTREELEQWLAKNS